VNEVPELMMFYGAVAAGMYVCVWLFYLRAFSIREKMEFNGFELFYTRMQIRRLILMFSVPLFSILLCLVFNNSFPQFVGLAAGMAYWLYFPLMLLWGKRFSKGEKQFLKSEKQNSAA
ncbi:MAG: hypothetical protein ACPF8V_09550, partial [Luteibaculum sp.]